MRSFVLITAILLNACAPAWAATYSYNPATDVSNIKTYRIYAQLGAQLTGVASSSTLYTVPANCMLQFQAHTQCNGAGLFAQISIAGYYFANCYNITEGTGGGTFSANNHPTVTGLIAGPTQTIGCNKSANGSATCHIAGTLFCNGTVL